MQGGKEQRAPPPGRQRRRGTLRRRAGSTVSADGGKKKPGGAGAGRRGISGRARGRSRPLGTSQSTPAVMAGFVIPSTSPLPSHSPPLFSYHPSVETSTPVPPPHSFLTSPYAHLPLKVHTLAPFLVYSILISTLANLPLFTGSVLSP